MEPEKTDQLSEDYGASHSGIELPQPGSDVTILAVCSEIVELVDFPDLFDLPAEKILTVATPGNTATSLDNSIIRSVAFAVGRYKVAEIIVLGHTRCSMMMQTTAFMDGIEKSGVTRTDIEAVDLRSWAGLLSSPAENVRQVVLLLQRHKAVPRDIPVTGLLLNDDTLRVERVAEYEPLTELAERDLMPPSVLEGIPELPPPPPSPPEPEEPYPQPPEYKYRQTAPSMRDLAEQVFGTPQTPPQPRERGKIVIPPRRQPQRNMKKLNVRRRKRY